MTPAQRLALLVLLDEYLHPERGDLDPCFYGPYGRVFRRTGLAASRIAQIELDLTGAWASTQPRQIQLVCDALHTPYPSDLLERSYE